MLARADLLRFLKKECEERGATIIYATHIFDGLEDWPSHIVGSSTYLPSSLFFMYLDLEKKIAYESFIFRFMWLMEGCN